MADLTWNDLDRIANAGPDALDHSEVVALVDEVRQVRGTPLTAARCPECAQSLERHIAYKDGNVVFLCGGQTLDLDGVLSRLAGARADVPAALDTGRWVDASEGGVTTWKLPPEGYASFASEFYVGRDDDGPGWWAHAGNHDGQLPFAGLTPAGVAALARIMAHENESDD